MQVIDKKGHTVANKTANGLYVRHEWTLFRNVPTISQVAGVPVNRLRRLCAKELADNALDAGGSVQAGELPGGGFFVEDDGPGIQGTPEDIARIFSFNRPFMSSKVKRAPTRGALGNGSRVVAGLVYATKGTLRVRTNGWDLALVPQANGESRIKLRTRTPTIGTRVEVILGDGIPDDPGFLSWADAAIQAAGREPIYSGKSSPYFYDSDSFHELLQAAGPRPVRAVMREMDGGDSEAVARYLRRKADVVAPDDAEALLGLLRSGCQPVQPSALNLLGKCLLGSYAKAFGVLRLEPTRGAVSAEVPYTVEAWCLPSHAGRDLISILVNRTPVTGSVSIQRDEKKSDVIIFGCNLGYRFAHIEFYSGATVILEGPADFKLISRSEAYCTRGRLRATVPAQAQGFAIKTPAVNLVDRGTEFGLAVGTGDPTEVHVFQGKVELHEPAPVPDGPPPALTTGQSVRLDGPDAAGRPIPSNPARFLTAQAVARRSTEELQRRHQAWLAASAALRQDPSLVAYYTFQHDADRPWDRTLADQAPGPAHDGTVVGCEWGTGRWPGKQGLEFRQVSDRVRVHIPGEFDSITLAAWVRVDALPNRNNALLLTDGWEPGDVHWQIGDGGRLVLGVQGNMTARGSGAHYHAYDVFTPERLGKWTHLAVVYDRAAGVVTHYVDGLPASALSITPTAPTALRIRDATIGNWNIASLQNDCPVRYLSGCMDELMLFARPLSGVEIQRLYAEGRAPL
jgi:hypothetical protein